MNSIYFVFILTNPARTLLCVGITPDLVGRMREYEGRRRVPHTFPGRHRCYQLVHYEEYDRPEVAVARGRELRNWKRHRKLRLISRANPHWRPLNAHFTSGMPAELSQPAVPF